MLLATTPIIEGKRITTYYGIVSGETIIGANVFRDFFASIRDIVGGRSGSYEEVLREAKDTALKEMSEQARQMGANAVIGANVFKDFFAGIRDIVGGRAGSYESVLREAKETALKEMSDHATQLGANAVIAIDLDYETVGGSGSMLMVTASGTAVFLE